MARLARNRVREKDAMVYRNLEIQRPRATNNGNFRKSPQPKTYTAPMRLARIGTFVLLYFCTHWPRRATNLRTASSSFADSYPQCRRRASAILVSELPDSLLQHFLQLQSHVHRQYDFFTCHVKLQMLLKPTYIRPLLACNRSCVTALTMPLRAKITNSAFASQV